MAFVASSPTPAGGDGVTAQISVEPDVAVADEMEPTRAPRVRGRAWTIARRASGVLALVFLGALLHGRLIAPLLHERESSMLEERLASDLLNGVAPVNQPVEPGRPIGLVEIPAVGLRAVVAEGSTAEQLAKSAGHLIGSSLPGQYGTSAILGRSQNFGAEFARLDDVDAGDEVVVTTGLGPFRYRVVDSTVRPPDDAAAFVGEGNMLLLITVANDIERLVVRAEAVDTVAVIGTEIDRVTSSDELGLEGQPGSGWRLVSWLVLALVAAVLQPFVARSLGRWVTWMLFFPVFAWTAVGAWNALALMAPAAL